jgi:protein-S-isoprenylcysteine O-methyltransferase Ste14
LRSNSVVVVILAVALTSCATVPSSQDANDIVVILRGYDDWAWAVGIVFIWADVTGFVTTGPYRHVRHPIYLGLSTLALGQALAFASWPAFVVLSAGIVPTFYWRAAAEEKLLTATFGERYARYRTQTKMIIPHVL